MKTRMTALLLSAALLAALGVNAATAERAPEAEAPAVTETAPETPPAETVVVAETAETAETAEITEAAEIAETAEIADEAAQSAPALNGALGFGDLRERMMQGYYPLLTLDENIRTLDEWDYQRTEDDLREALSTIVDQEYAMDAASVVDPAMMANMTPVQIAGVAGASAASAVVSPVIRSQLESQYDSYRKIFDDVRKGKLQADNEGVKRQLRNAQDQVILLAESYFITCKSLEAQDAALTRTISALERSERELKLRSELGQISALTLQQVSSGLVQARSGQKTLRMNRDNILLLLKSMCGVGYGETLRLGALPQVTAAQLGAMDLETDFARARELSYELFDAKRTYDNAKEEYENALKKYGETSKKNEWMQAKHTWQAAQYAYEGAKQSFELKFRALYAQVRDAAQVLDAKRSAVAAQEKLYAADALRYKQGSISANALAEAKDKLAEAKETAASAERDLFTQYRSYENAVTYGILNS